MPIAICGFSKSLLTTFLVQLISQDVRYASLGKWASAAVAEQTECPVEWVCTLHTFIYLIPRMWGKGSDKAGIHTL